MTKRELEKVTGLLYSKGLNTSGRIKNYPESNKRILLPPEISVINTVTDFVKKQKYIRVAFIGSDKFYEYYPKESSYLQWVDKITNHKFEDDDIDNEEDMIW